MAKKLIDLVGLEQAQAIQLLRLHNPDFIFQGFAYVSTATPAHALNYAWIVAENGTVFGQTVVKGQVIYSTGSLFVVDNLQGKVNKIIGKGLSSNDFDNAAKDAVEIIEGKITNTDASFAIVDENDNAVFVVDNNGESDFLPTESLKKRIVPTLEDNPSDSRLIITDDNYNKVLEISNEGVNFIPSPEFIENYLGGNSTGGHSQIDGSDEYTLTDEAGNVVMRANSEGVEFAEKPAFNLKTMADIIHVITYGQSLSCGYESFPIQTPSQKFDALMFNTGTIFPADNDETNITSLIPLIEQAVGEQGETPCSGIVDAVKYAFQRYTKIAPVNQGFQVLATACGIGGEVIANLISSNANFNRIKKSIDKGFALAQSQGKTYKVGAVCWLQGETDNAAFNVDKSLYKSQLLSIQHDVDVYAKTVTGQTEDVVLITYQTCTNAQPALAQFELSQEEDNIECSGPVYALPQTLIHLTGSSSYAYGMKMGEFLFNKLFRSEKQLPTHPTDFFVQGNILQIKFSAKNYPLVLDSYILTWNNSLVDSVVLNPANFSADFVADKSNFGFSIKNGSGIEIIESVSVSRFDTIKIVCSENPEGFILKYASKNYSLLYQSGTYSGSRVYGGLHDTPKSFAQTSSGAIALSNWCVQFVKQL